MTTVFWRETFINDLHTQFTKDLDQHRRTAEVEAHIIVGTGGVGKTTVVRRYIQQHKVTYNHIILIDAQDPSTAENQFKLLATTKLDIKTDMENKPKDFPTLLNEIYDKLVQHQALVLIIFDNAEVTTNTNGTDPSPPKGIRPFLPKSLPPHSVDPIVIITSRQRNWDASIYNIISLDLWSEEECSNFVLEKLGLNHTDKNRATALALGNYFGCLPIAVQSAVSIILQQLERQKHSGKVSYEIHHLISDYGSAKQKMLTETAEGCCSSSSSSSHFPEMSLWDVSLKKIVKLKNGTPPIQILCFMAYLFPNTIPIDFLRALFQQDTSKNKNKGPHSSTALALPDSALDDALVLLTDYSLITLFDAHYTIHRMIQDAIIHHLREPRNGKKSESTSKIFNKNTYSNETHVLTSLSNQICTYLGDLPIQEILSGQKAEAISNGVHVTTHFLGKLQLFQNPKVRSFTQSVANILEETYSWDGAVDLYKKLLDTFLQDKKVDNLKVLEMQERIVDILEYQGNFEEALDLYSKMLPLQLQLKALGQRHPSTIETQTNIVFTLQKLGRADKAKAQFDQVQSALKRSDKNGADLTVTAKYNVACLHYEHSNFNEALILLKEILEKQALRQGQLSTLRTTCMMTEVLSKQGKYDTAQDRRYKVPRTTALIHVTFFSCQFHKSKLTYRTDFAWKLFLRGKLERALKIFQELIQDSDDDNSHSPRRSGTSDHLPEPEPESDISFTKHCIADILHDLKEYEKSIQILKEILVTKERQFGPQHFLTLGTKEYIALTLCKQRKYSEAIEMYQSVLQAPLQLMTDSDVEPPHFDIDLMSTRLLLGWAYFHKGEYRSSKKISKDVKNIFKNNQSLKIQFQGHYAEAKKLREKSKGRRSAISRFCRCLRRSCNCCTRNKSADPKPRDKSKKTLDELYGKKDTEGGDVDVDVDVVSQLDYADCG